MKSYLFVFVQFFCIGLIIITGPTFPANKVLLLIESLGIGLGIWAVFSMSIGNFNITPDLKKDSHLVTNGPYKLIRHPMYTSILLVTLPLIINHATSFRIATWLVLLIDLVIKLNYEENILSKSLRGYLEYMKKSSRIIPFLY